MHDFWLVLTLLDCLEMACFEYTLRSFWNYSFEFVHTRTVPCQRPLLGTSLNSSRQFFHLQPKAQNVTFSSGNEDGFEI